MDRDDLAYKAWIGNAKTDRALHGWTQTMSFRGDVFGQTIACPHWSAPLPRPPGIYWRRTGGKTHTVEVVR